MSGDPYKYFRIEARELLQGLSQGVLELEKGASSKDVVGRLLRLAHTLKGASRVVKQPAIGDMAHAIEDALAPYRDGQDSVAGGKIDEILKLLDGIAARVSSLDPATPVRREGPPAPAPDDLGETVRVDLGEMDALLDAVTETAIQLAGLEGEMRALDRAGETASKLVDEAGKRRALESEGRGSTRDVRASALAEELDSSLAALRRSLGVRVEQSRRELVEVQERAHRLRLLPAGAIFGTLERAVRDAAQSLGKRVEFQVSGGEIRLDAHVLSALRGALLHVVRNSVAHGIEREGDRLGAGKPAAGRIALSVERRGSRVAFACHDDGRGIDVEAVREAAGRKGLLASAKGAPPVEEILRLLLKGGVTTTGEVTEVSGRGIGLDVVRETMAKLKGEVNVRTEKGRGTAFEIVVPVSLSSLPAILVEAAGTTAAVPIDSVPSTRRVAEGEIARSPDGDSLLYEGKAIPFMILSRIFAREGMPGKASGPWSTLIIRAADGHAAVGVDRVLGTSNVVVRHLPAWVTAHPAVAGAALGTEGTAQVVLDPEGLVREARGAAARAAPRPEARPPVLVVDDSLTTRMLEQSILESSGYDVELAVSGEEALSMARRRKHGVFIVDIEMPGMDGFEFIAQTRADPALRGTAAILVTSRGSDEDRRRGEQLGACAYIVKSEFDQGRLLRIIQGLIG